MDILNNQNKRAKARASSVLHHLLKDVPDPIHHGAVLQSGAKTEEYCKPNQ